MVLWTCVGERVNKIREKQKLSKAQFGKKIGVSGQYIGMVEKGIQGLSAESIVKICHTTGVSADYLLFGAVNPEEDLETTAALNGLSNEQIQIALDIIKKVAQFINTENGNEALIQEVVRQQNIGKTEYN